MGGSLFFFFSEVGRRAFPSFPLFSLPEFVSVAKELLGTRDRLFCTVQQCL